MSEGARGQRQPARLLRQSGEYPRMAVALIDGRVCGQAVQIAVAVNIRNPDALTPGEDDVEGLVVVSPEPALHLNIIGPPRLHCRSSDRSSPRCCRPSLQHRPPKEAGDQLRYKPGAFAAFIKK